MKPPSSGPTRGGDRRRGADQGVGLLLRRSLEVAVDQRLHRGQQQRRAEPADDRPEDDDRGQALGQRHRQGADGVAEQAQHVGALAPDEVADLAADQDERRGDQRLERDRGLDAADGRVEIVDHRGDRDVHQRRVDDEHEHRHRQQHGEPWIARRLLGGRRLAAPGSRHLPATRTPRLGFGPGPALACPHEGSELTCAPPRADRSARRRDDGGPARPRRRRLRHLRGAPSLAADACAGRGRRGAGECPRRHRRAGPGAGGASGRRAGPRPPGRP